MKSCRQFSGACLALALLILCSTAQAAPAARLWERWSAHDPASTSTIDHANWHALLQQYVVRSDDGVNRFAYRRLLESETERKRLREYLNRMSQIEISQYNRDQQRAYWINLYNAITIEVVLDDYPVESIRDIRSGLFSPGPWKRKLIEIENEELTLDDIEHRILRPVWQDPRVHYAVTCASIGCPNLQPEAFTADHAEILLHRGADQFVNHPRGARVVDGKLQVSSIYRWFEADFGGSETGVIDHLKRYARSALRKALDGIDRISGDDYDWSINAAENHKS